MNDCILCPRLCHVNRNKEVGFCKANDKLKIAKADLFYYEEPCLGTSGAIFFSNCNLRCIFCQNYEISTNNIGKEITIEEFSNICITLQNKGADNINLVTPTIYVPLIIKGLDLAKEKGLNIPIIYNSSGYETVETLKLLEGYIDIYLPDFKYFSDKYSLKYSKVKNYSKNAIEIISEMVRQVGPPVFDNNGIMKKGVIVRHLMLPGLLFDSKKVIDLIYNTFNDKVYISLMNQYTPLYNAKDYPEINKSINPKVYDSLINYALSIGVKNGFIQDAGTDTEDFVPDFNNKGV